MKNLGILFSLVSITYAVSASAAQTVTCRDRTNTKTYSVSMTDIHQKSGVIEIRESGFSKSFGASITYTAGNSYMSSELVALWDQNGESMKFYALPEKEWGQVQNLNQPNSDYEPRLLCERK